MVRFCLNKRGFLSLVKSPEEIRIFFDQESYPSFFNTISCSPADSNFEIFVSLKSCRPSMITLAPVGNDSICAIPFCSNFKLELRRHPSTIATNTKTNATTARDIIMSTKITRIILLRLRLSMSILHIL